MQLQSTLQNYKQNHVVNMNVPWDKMGRFLLCLDDRSSRIYLLDLTEENYINTRVINHFTFIFVT